MYPLGFLIFILSVSSTVLSEDPEPAFPHLLNPESIGENRIHILSESVSDEFGYETKEEYIDFEKGKNTFVKTGKTGHSTTYYDARANIIYHYKPYECQALQPNEMEATGFSGMWNSFFNLKINDEYKTMRLYGVAALWWNAGKQQKIYKSTKLIYSASHDVYKQAYQWTTVDEKNQQLVHLYFVQNKIANDYSLELIEIESNATNKVVQTLNILSVENFISSDIANTLMEVPVGYGCMSESVTNKALIEFPDLSDIYLGPLLKESHKIELEVTATEYRSDDKKAKSDTISVQVARHKVEDIFGGGMLQLVRQRDSSQDIKSIYHYLFGVLYEIDLRRGSCEMSHLLMKKGENEEDFLLSFKTEQWLDMSLETLETIFINMTDFYFIKSVNSGLAGSTSYLYFERTLTNFLDTKARIVRVYSMTGSDKEVTLERVTVWLYNQNWSQITESFHFNLVEASELKSATELAKLFDVSEECYLNNEEMRSGRDYVWFELTYPVSARASSILASHNHNLKELIYSRFLTKGHLSFFRVPKLEIMFEETGFILRALLIDVAKLSVLYDMARKGGILVSKKDQGDQVELGVDLDHCADLCRLHKCKVMSYCEDTRQCLMSSLTPEEGGNKFRIEDSPKCNTYTVPALFDKEEFHELSLQYTVNLLQNQDYGVLALPKMPEELTYSRAESGLDENTYNSIMVTYLDQLNKYLEEDEHRLPMLTFSTTIEQTLIILLPEKFEVEDDPLNEFSLAVQDQPVDDDRVPAFHQGLVMRKYRMNLLTPTADSKANIARLFGGLNYDQCAIACVDSKCSSFSYCVHRQECIITDIYNISSVSENIQEDAECFISQRDFVSKFHKFPNVIRSELYKRSATAQNPSECAHSCMVESDFKCLAFDYCVSTRGATLESTCLYFDERQLSAEPNIPAITDKTSISKETGCDHYSRSYLADFIRVEYKELLASELAKLKTTTIEGRSVDKCAEICATDILDCTAFQFCIDPDVKQGPMQSCILIESAPEGNQADYEVILEKGVNSKIKQAGKFFVQNSNCHVFSLSKDSSEAQVRDLALSSLTQDELDASKNEKNSSRGLTIVQGICLYLALTLVFATIGCGVVLARHNSEYIRQKMERIQILLGF